MSNDSGLKGWCTLSGFIFVTLPALQKSFVDFFAWRFSIENWRRFLVHFSGLRVFPGNKARKILKHCRENSDPKHVFGVPKPHCSKPGCLQFYARRSFALFCKLAFALFSGHLRSFACSCVRPRLERPRLGIENVLQLFWPTFSGLRGCVFQRMPSLTSSVVLG